MKTPIVYKIAGNLRCLLVDNGQKISIGRAPECDVQIDGEEVHEVEATLQFVQDCNSVSISPASGTAAYEQPLPWTLPLGGFDLVFYRPSNPDKHLEKGATHEITLQGLAPEKLSRVLKQDRPLLLGSNADCDVVISSGDCPPVQLALWAAADNKVVVQVLDNSSVVDWLGRGENIEAEMEFPASLSLGGKMVLINAVAVSHSQPMQSPALVPAGPRNLAKSAPPPIVVDEFYINKNNQQHGPFSEEEIRQLVYEGTYNVNDRAWKEGASDWAPLNQLISISGPPRILPLSNNNAAMAGNEQWKQMPSVHALNYDNGSQKVAPTALIKLSWILLGLMCLAACIPGLGFGTWALASPILLTTFILGIIVLTRNATFQGVSILLASVVVVPVVIFVAPIVSTLVAGGVVSAIEDSAGRKAAQNPNIQPKMTKQIEAAPSPSMPAGIGADVAANPRLKEIVKVGHFEWIIAAVRLADEFRSSDGIFNIEVGSPDTILLFVQGQVTNRSREKDVALGNLYVVDEEGTKYGEHDESSLVSSPLVMDSFNPNVPKSFSTVFEVPRKAKGLKFEVSDFAILGEKTALIDLGIEGNQAVINETMTQPRQSQISTEPTKDRKTNPDSVVTFNGDLKNYIIGYWKSVNKSFDDKYIYQAFTEAEYLEGSKGLTPYKVITVDGNTLTFGWTQVVTGYKQFERKTKINFLSEVKMIIKYDELSEGMVYEKVPEDQWLHENGMVYNDQVIQELRRKIGKAVQVSTEPIKGAVAEKDLIKMPMMEKSVTAYASPPVKIGERFKLGDFCYTITSVKSGPSVKSAASTNVLGEVVSLSEDLNNAMEQAFGMQKASSRKIAPNNASFLVVRYIIENQGNDVKIVSTKDFKLLDSKKRTFSTSSEATMELALTNEASFLLAELQPGVQDEGAQVFLLPNDALDENLTLVIPEKGLLGTGERHVQIGTVFAKVPPQAVGSSIDSFTKNDQTSKVTKTDPLVNTLGMRFVPVSGLGVLFSVWETRLKDFKAFVEATNYDAISETKNGLLAWTLEPRPDGGPLARQAGGSWKDPHFPFKQADDEPVVCVSNMDAEAFCAWLTAKEINEGRIGPKHFYRLPTDEEWSVACGSQKYPWGVTFPPSGKEDGNYMGIEAMVQVLNNVTTPLSRAGFSDGAARTAVVGRFNPNFYGLYDMGGNVSEWCSSWYRASMNDAETLEANSQLKKDEGGNSYKVTRGGSWADFATLRLRCAYRDFGYPQYRNDNIGFRCVLDMTQTK
jgi:formylglycine-generating enzyme required for sulfatase activity